MAVLPWWLFVALFIVVGLVATVLLIRKDTADPSRDHRPALLVVGRFLAILYAVLTLIGTGVNVVATLVSDAVQVALPVQQFWSGVYPWVTLDPKPAASVVGGGFRTADVLVTGLGTDARLLLAAGNLVQGLTLVVIATVVALLCHRLLGGSPFQPLLARSIMRTGALIAVGGIVWQLLFGIGASIASHQVLELTGWSASVPTEGSADYLFTALPDSGLPDPTLAVSVDFWPLFLGLALAAIAFAFRYGERLQRDTEGLV